MTEPNKTGAEDLEIRRFLRALDQRIKKAIDDATDDHAYGTVHSIGPLMVIVDGATSAAPATPLGSYTPAVNDRVFITIVRNNLIVHGTV